MLILILKLNIKANFSRDFYNNNTKIYICINITKIKFDIRNIM